MDAATPGVLARSRRKARKIPGSGAEGNAVNTNTSRMLSIDELAKRLNCHPSTIRRMAKLGRLPALRVGALYRFDFEAVIKALTRDRGSV